MIDKLQDLGTILTYKIIFRNGKLIVIKHVSISTRIIVGMLSLLASLLNGLFFF